MHVSDLPLFRKWLALPHIAAWYHDPEDWVGEVEQQDGTFAFVRHFIVQSENKPIGFCQYYPYWMSGEAWHGNIPLEGTYSIDYLIGDVEYLGKGYGKQIIRALQKKIQSLPDAARIIVQPEPENQASCGVLQSCGFHYDAENGIYLLRLSIEVSIS